MSKMAEVWQFLQENDGSSMTEESIVKEIGEDGFSLARAGGSIARNGVNDDSDVVYKITAPKDTDEDTK